MTDREERFTKIYHQNIWGGIESKSGKGSDPEQTKHLKPKLIELINRLKIKTLIDAPCGTLAWMKLIVNELNLEKYIGMDIVPDLIKDLQSQYVANKTMQFKQCDIVTDILPEGDLLLCRDCLVHLSNEDIKSFLLNFYNSQIPYLLTTTFIKKRNYSHYAGSELRLWRPLVLWQEPIFLPHPSEIFFEGCTEIDTKNNESYSDKSLGLWKREEIKEVICGTYTILRR